MQLTHQQSHFNRKSFPIILVCDGVMKAPNIGSLLRLADAFGIDKIYFCGEQISIGKRMTKTSRTTEKHVNFETGINAIEIVQELQFQGYQIISLEITQKSMSIKEFQLNQKKPIALVIGHENFGINERIIDISDQTVHINMYGHNSSMSVVQATSIALYELTNQLK